MELAIVYPSEQPVPAAYEREITMKYTGLPSAMWMIYRNTFREHLISDLRFSRDEANDIVNRAAPRYREIIGKIPEFEKGDRFVTNIVNCAMLTAFLLCMNRRPSVDELTVFYRNAMKGSFMTRMFCRKSGKSKFSDKDIAGQKATAALRAGDRNPYSWNMDYIPYEDNSGYEARFYTCGICALMKEYGFYDLVPAMCSLDYTMSELGGASEFVRQYTLASGGSYCDCGYKKKAPPHSRQP